MNSKIFLINIIIIYILISFNFTSFAGLDYYVADKYIMEIKNINESIEKIDLVNYEECNSKEVSQSLQTYTEQVSLFDKDSSIIVPNYNKEFFYVEPSISYNYLYGESTKNPELHVISGHTVKHDDNGNIVALDIATDKKFKNKNQLIGNFWNSTDNIQDLEFICVRTITYTCYKITPIKQLDTNQIISNTFTYDHDDLENLTIGIRFLNTNQEYKTYLTKHPYIGLERTMGTEKLDSAKIIRYDYETRSYETNASYDFTKPKTDPLIYLIISLSTLLIIIIVVYKIIRKKLNNT